MAVDCLQGSQVVCDLAAATLCMLSQRVAAHEPLANAGAIPALLQLLDPLQSPCAEDNAAKALGNLSADTACRSLIRSSGGVGALLRMVKDDCPDTMQVGVQFSHQAKHGTILHLVLYDCCQSCLLLAGAFCLAKVCGCAGRD